MRVTEAVEIRLEKLKELLLLGSSIINPEGYSRVENMLYGISGWKIEDYKPLIGKAYRRLTEIKIKIAEDVGKPYVRVWSSNLEVALERAERDRTNFEKIQKDFESFGYKILDKEEQKKDGE